MSFLCRIGHRGRSKSRWEKEMSNKTEVLDVSHDIRVQNFKFARDWAAGASDKVQDTIREVDKRAAHLTKVALYASMPHQIIFLVSVALAKVDLSSLDVKGYISIASLLCVILPAPYLADLLILNSVAIIGNPVSSRWTRIRAFLTMLIPAAFSGFVNVKAPAPHALINWLAGFLVAAIVLAQVQRVFRPEFKRLLDAQESVVAEVKPVFDEGPEDDEPVEVEKPRRKRRISPQEEAARQAAGYYDMDRGGKISFSHSRRQDKRNRRRNVPVSPATTQEGLFS